MKRIGILFLLLAMLSGAAFAQADISGVGTDFENLIEQIGEEMLPNIEQSAIWGQYPGQAALPEGSRFFFTGSLGAVLGFNGLLGFVEPTNAAFDTLNIYEIVNTVLTSGGDGGAAASSAIETLQNFFPYPIARFALGFALPADLEMMADFAIFPQFISNGVVSIANNWVTIPPFVMNALHAGTRVRKVVLRDAPGLPAISIGAGHSYTGFNIGYDFGSLDGIDTAIGSVHLAGEFFLQNRIHSFGIDFQMSKNLGAFVPFIGISPYFQLAGFTGGIGTTASPFDAYVDFENGGTERDIEYDADDPNTTLTDNDLALVLFGGFDLVFGKLALQVHGSYSIGEAWPAVTIGTRWQ
jgi:hypothetical protein